ncbi:type II toxin-antitoxin system PemK/MazF family toxin [Gordonia shandongensis]|uniref:type II toxin-antitoxin system PemK/MazF family toxin n=1 Tax=Gordonia shandongensis TaxID=376351 RepID=UPI001B7FB16E|nr:type II toxin-antitoxin system PemK/MazF family toxin [Gordonia shandongensis]
MPLVTAGPRPSARRSPGHPTGDFARTIVYAPDLDGAADPGEIVWTWVPFEDDPDQGKDRPVLVVGRDGGPGDHTAGDGMAGDDRAGGDMLLGLMLSSRDYHRDDPDWVSIGSGPWDRDRRESFVRLDRVLQVAEHGIRREGAVCERARFDAVADRLRARFGWT